MEKLLQLLNEYEDSRWDMLDDWLTDEERESWAIIETKPRWSEYKWHLRIANANTVAFERDTFDSYALSKTYWFVRWLLNHWKLGTDFLSPLLKMNKRYNLGTHDTILMFLSTKENPVAALISMLK